MDTLPAPPPSAPQSPGVELSSPPRMLCSLTTGWCQAHSTSGQDEDEDWAMDHNWIVCSRDDLAHDAERLMQRVRHVGPVHGDGLACSARASKGGAGKGGCQQLAEGEGEVRLSLGLRADDAQQ